VGGKACMSRLLGHHPPGWMAHWPKGQARSLRLPVPLAWRLPPPLAGDRYLLSWTSAATLSQETMRYPDNASLAPGETLRSLLSAKPDHCQARHILLLTHRRASTAGSADAH
jgi:hypothetical protein